MSIHISANKGEIAKVVLQPGIRFVHSTLLKII